jgi:uncharacterized membrane protein (UPF0127 family)
MLSPVRNLWLLSMLLSLGLAAVGCRKPSPAVPAPDPAGHLNQAQPRLPAIKLWAGTNALTTEIARTQTQVMTGMMFRESMEENEAMLFVFPYPHQASFYMKNTLLPLSCAYLDNDGTILEIHDLQPQNETAVPAATDRIRFVLETKQGWFQRHQVNIGTVISTEHGSLLQTFFRTP